MRSVKQVSNQTGFTLIELMVVVSIMTILALMAMPSFGDFINRTKQSAVVSQLGVDLNRARSEAIKRNSRMLVCLRNNDTTCATAGTDWNNGWLVCADADADNACDAGTADLPNPLVVHQAVDAGLSVVGTDTVLRFNPNGTSSAVATLTVGASWAGAIPKIINIAVTGNVSRL
jgi:type IV fimbrial biogenesis protein FimT